MTTTLLREYYELCEGGVCQDLLTEQEKINIKEKGTVYLSGLMQEAGVLNGNGRVYEPGILMREIEAYKKVVQERRALGELDHPDDSVINLKNASHLVVGVWNEGNKVYGKIEVLDTPSGRILKDLISAGVKLGISSRGLGSLKKKDGKNFVQDDFQLICFDMVSEPSTPNAYMLKEAKQISSVPNRKYRISKALNEVLKEQNDEE
jgi:hypothetical protein